ncbi:condensation domain-containing protein [Actinokineospora sp. NBRC 105648]|uniref:condensation domain-containing protein n=1 Tax=Actinokineospora sp. NBRC 105648 TaxID=3032206 RepID=UPI0024A1554D|nr:condensation domain-containing protein [Actinokineospora sp. NBRC 105648]GLZ43490.1 hypothetical protein Acsp05_71140 [Actinokineospora sp. NBRC 105648]
MITRGTADVVFHSGRSRTGTLAWGQRGTWDIMAEWLPEMKPFFVLSRWLDIPLLLELGDVLDILGELLSRHESLRTHYHRTPRGDATQEVLAAGTLTIEVFDRPADDPVTFADIVTDCTIRLGGTPIDHGTELPIRVAVALHEGIPVLLYFAVSHLSADNSSADLLVTELGKLFRARADGLPLPPPRPAQQPLDLVAHESSPEGQLRTIEAVRYLRAQLARLTPGMLPARAEPVAPRFHRGELESDAIPVAVRLAARRYRTTTSVILLSITTALVRDLVVGPVYALEIMQGNRTAPELFGTVSSLNQAVLTAVEVTAGSFAELVRQSEQCMAAAARHARYDARATRAVPRQAVPGCQFNDMWSTLPRSRAIAVDLVELAAATTFSWPQTAESEGMSLFLDTRGTSERLQLSLMADTALLPPAEIRAFLYAFEQLALDLAQDAGNPSGRRAS